MSDWNRRKFFTAAVAFAALTASARRASAKLNPTPDQTEGPFYPDKLPNDTDNDLVRIEGRVAKAGGEILGLAGRVLTADGQPVVGALVEIWQCDMNGRYAHSGDWGRGKRDADFQGYGRTRTGPDGGYSFRTIKPVAYPGRTPHIHFKAHYPDGRVLTTQMYVSGDPRNNRDGIYRSMNEVERAAVSVALSRADEAWAGSFDIVLV